MKLRCLPLAALLVFCAGCASDPPANSSTLRATSATAPELTQPEFLYAVLRYLDRWHLDAATFTRLNNDGQVEIWVRSIEVPTDEGDRSRFAELWLPGARTLVELKQADHDVPERKLAIKDDSFKVRAVHRLNAGPVSPNGWKVRRLRSEEVFAHLFQTQHERLFPDATLENRLRQALAAYLRQHHEKELLTGQQTFYAAPVSPVCGELWIYWEDQRMALRFAAEGDLANPRIWEEVALHVRAISLDERVTLSPEAATSPGGFISRDWAGRLLYNCIILGRKFTLPPTR
jgi:hypothetical protein